jgi:hypothetical protein
MEFQLCCAGWIFCRFLFIYWKWSWIQLRSLHLRREWIEDCMINWEFLKECDYRPVLLKLCSAIRLCVCDLRCVAKTFVTHWTYNISNKKSYPRILVCCDKLLHIFSMSRHVSHIFNLSQHIFLHFLCVATCLFTFLVCCDMCLHIFCVSPAKMLETIIIGIKKIRGR